MRQLSSLIRQNTQCTAKNAISFIFGNSSLLTCIFANFDTKQELGAPAGSVGQEEAGREAESNLGP